MTISRKSASAASEIRFLSRRRPASAHGLRPTMSPPVSSASRTMPSASGSKTATRPAAPPALLHGRQVEQEVPLRTELVALDPLADEVELLRVEHRHPARLVRDRLVDRGPLHVGARRVRDSLLQSLIDLRLNSLVAELREVRA